MHVLIDLGNQLIADAIYQFLTTDGAASVMKSPAPDFVPEVLLVDVATAKHPLFTPYPHAKILVIDTGEGKEQLLSILLSSHIHGILSTQAGLHHLKKALTAVSEGRIWIDSDSLKVDLEDTGVLSKKGVIRGVTERHREIIDCVCRGLSNREIGQKLGLSDYTVKAHLNRIFRKLRVKSRSQLMTLVLDHPKHALARSA